MYRILCLLLFFPALCLSYEVEFRGISDKETLNQLQASSLLVKKQHASPRTIAALRRRAERDVPQLLKVMHSFAYLEAKIDLDVSKERVLIIIEEGPIYPLAACTVEGVEADIESLGIILGEPAYPKTILQAEDFLVKQLVDQGYALAKVEVRDVIVDLEKKAAFVTFKIDPGPICYFGETEIIGNKKVKDLFFRRKLLWCKGDLYDEQKILETERAIEASSLFSSLTVTAEKSLDEEGLLPLTITVEENAQRSVSIGLAYATILGPGISFEWENRNLCGLGEKLSFQTRAWWRFQQGKLLYLQPEFFKKGQDLLLQAELEHEKTKGFQERSVTLSAILENRLTKSLRLSYGLQAKELSTFDSDNNRSYTLFKAPFQVRYSHTDNLLDPTCGFAFHLKLIPAIQTLHPRFAYVTKWLTASYYHPMQGVLIFATKLTAGSIFGASRFNIPPSERFYAGSDTCLRGYHYLTVSPLTHQKRPKPLGGRSILALSLEAREHREDSLGWVLFYDVGNVWSSYIPDLREKLLQSVGIGARYGTPVGPLRADLAFPLNRRKHLDSFCQLYISIGQAF